MDVDWEFPVDWESKSLSGHEEDKQNFVLLLQEMRNVLNPAGKLVTTAVGSTLYQGRTSYDVAGIAQNVDFINLMTYDYHGWPWGKDTGINSPLYSNDQLNLSDSVQYWLDNGCPREKLVIGVPTYGRSFTLADQNQNGIGAATSAPGRPGPVTRSEGSLAYYEIVANQWPRQWKEDQKAPYAFQGDQWVGYDDTQSAQEKANFCISNDLGGCMFWSIDTDDFRNGNAIMSTVSQAMTSARSFEITGSRFKSSKKDKGKLKKASEKAHSKLSSCFSCFK